MRSRIVLAPLAVLALGLTACSSEKSTSVTVEQPTDDLGSDNLADISTPDAGAQAASDACLGGKKVTGRSLRIVTTVAPITNLVALVAGTAGPSVQGIVPEGTNSHTFEPPPSAAATLEQADIIFVNGLALEDPTRALADANAKNAVICELGTATLPKAGWLYDFSFPEEAGKPNPHLWTNPPMVLAYVTLIRDVLVNADPANTDKYDANYAAVSNVVMALDNAMKTATETIPADDRKLLTYHDAYAYFAVHFGFEVVGAVQPQSFEEPSPQDIASLIEQVKSEGIKAVFGSEVFPSPVLEQIGKETGVRYVDVLRDDDLPDEPGDIKHSWAGLMQFDYVTIVEALGGDASALKAVKIDTGIVDKANYPQ
jgi:ABC-type Zn uptake system ZnuABC Zn-binding protein ZnuA